MPSAPVRSPLLLCASAGLALGALALAPAHAGWTILPHQPPGPVNLMLLRSDGSVMAAHLPPGAIGRRWFRLTPDATGGYANGTWSELDQMNDTRLYYSSQVLKDGRVFVAGGEYGTGRAKAEIYDPVTNVWTQVPIPTSILDPSQNSPVLGSAQIIFDANSEILPDGRVLIMPVGPKTSGVPIIYNPTTNGWSNAGALFRGVYQDEATWVKLPDNTILTVDPFGTNSERYNPATNTWINDANLPVSLYDPFGFEMGGGLLLPNGKVFFLGATGHTALYTPSGSLSPGTWAAGPDIPNGRATPDAPCAMLVTGRVLCAVGPAPTSANHFPTPTYFYEYDPTTNSFTQTVAPDQSEADSIATFQGQMLNLPDGSVLYSNQSQFVSNYRPAGAPIAAGKPTIQTISANVDGSFHMVGLKLNGISEGASYGDDAQMNTNYPIVRVTDSLGVVRYGRTYNWSSTGVNVPTPVSTEFTLPAGLAPGTISLVVIANGFASDAAMSASVATPPASVSACGGQPASFSVSGSGFGVLSYQWRRGTTNLVNGGTISGATSATLTISSVGAGDAGTDYNCVVTNVLGSAVSDNATLSLCYANCDCSTGTPVLSASDFACFLGKFRAGDAYANCDGSTDTPSLTASDFACYLNAFRVGCP